MTNYESMKKWAQATPGIRKPGYFISKITKKVLEKRLTNAHFRCKIVLKKGR